MNYLETHKESFEQLFDLYMDWNSKINLSSLRDRESVWEKHFEDSLLIHKFFDLNDKKILDIGAGGGFPTLPLAITTNSAITALDSVGKKMKVVSEIGKTLQLENLKTKHGRFEDVAHDKSYREQFDVVTARAVAPWNVLLEYALPFVKVGGSFIAYQGPGVLDDLGICTPGHTLLQSNSPCHTGLDPVSDSENGTRSRNESGMTEDDIKKLKGIEKKLGGRLVRLEKTVLGDSERYFIEIKKVSPTNKQYPRKNGIPRKEPLGR